MYCYWKSHYFLLFPKRKVWGQRACVFRIVIHVPTCSLKAFFPLALVFKDCLQKYVFFCQLWEIVWHENNVIWTINRDFKFQIKFFCDWIIQNKLFIFCGPLLKYRWSYLANLTEMFWTQKYLGKYICLFGLLETKYHNLGGLSNKYISTVLEAGNWISRCQVGLVHSFVRTQVRLGAYPAAIRPHLNWLQPWWPLSQVRSRSWVLWIMTFSIWILG